MRDAERRWAIIKTDHVGGSHIPETSPEFMVANRWAHPRVEE
jgi:hypothetical protein